MKKNPLISFILPNYNNQHVLDLFFEKFLKNNTYQNYEFIVTDDGSEDYSLAVLRKWQNSGQIKNMTLIEEPHNGIINALNKSLANTGTIGDEKCKINDMASNTVEWTTEYCAHADSSPAYHCTIRGGMYGTSDSCPDYRDYTSTTDSYCSSSFRCVLYM